MFLLKDCDAQEASLPLQSTTQKGTKLSSEFFSALNSSVVMGRLLTFQIWSQELRRYLGLVRSFIKIWLVPDDHMFLTELP